jgi:hypothetical protein
LNIFSGFAFILFTDGRTGPCSLAVSHRSVKSISHRQ